MVDGFAARHRGSLRDCPVDSPRLFDFCIHTSHSRDQLLDDYSRMHVIPPVSPAQRPGLLGFLHNFHRIFHIVDI